MRQRSADSRDAQRIELSPSSSKLEPRLCETGAIGKRGREEESGMAFAKFMITLAALLLFQAVAIASEPERPAPGDLQFKRGINILGYDPIWKSPAKGRFQARHFTEIREAGFDFVRVNLHIFPHIDASNRLDPAWLERLDWVVGEARKAGLGVILDEHDFNACERDPPTCRTKLIAIWRQLAPRYASQPASVAFELLNEPHGAIDADAWNKLLVELLAIVRETNPTRTIVIGPTSWNNFAQLPTLRLPETDRNILVTFHYYDPFRFTHQGTSWTDLETLSGITWGSDADKAAIASDFAKVADWATANGRPILLGEFGAYDRSGTPLAMRMSYLETVAREAERRGFAWAYWQFDSDFVAWDMTKDSWVQPVRDALVPASR
jgi:endoglucanase